MPRFVTAYSKATGRKHRVPEHFIGNPILGRDLELAPSQRAADGAADPVPNEYWKVADLEAYAAEHDVDLTGATRKADILAAIAATTETSEPNQGDDETPATGDDKE